MKINDKSDYNITNDSIWIRYGGLSGGEKFYRYRSDALRDCKEDEIVCFDLGERGYRIVPTKRKRFHRWEE